MFNDPLKTPHLEGRELLAAIAAAPDPAGPDDDGDNDTKEVNRLKEIKHLVDLADAEHHDPRLAKASTLLQQAIDQEITEDAPA